MNNDNEIKEIFTEEKADLSPKEDKFQIFKQERRKDKKNALTNLSFTMNRIDMTNMIRQNQNKLKEKGRNLVSVNSYSSLSKSFLNRSFTGRLSFPTSSEKEIETMRSSKIKLPEMIDVNAQVLQMGDQIDKVLADIKTSFDNLNKSKECVREAQGKLSILQKELKEAKEARNQVMREVYQMRNEIEMIQEKAKESDLNKSNYMTQRTITSSGTNRQKYAYNVTHTSSNEANGGLDDLDLQIKMYENKISKLKADNTPLLESLDSLKEEYQRNEAQNIKLRNEISSIEYHIKNGLKEKANLKAAISKLSNCNNGKN